MVPRLGNVVSEIASFVMNSIHTLSKYNAPFTRLTYELPGFSSTHPLLSTFRAFFSIPAPRRISIRRYDDIALWPRARGNCRELIGLYHVKRFSSTKLLHGCLVSDRVNSGGPERARGSHYRCRCIRATANTFFLYFPATAREPACVL